MKLIPQWKKWWKRYSVQLLALIPLITIARDQLPMLQGMMSPSAYSYTMAGLAIAATLAMQVKQASVSAS